MSINKDYGYLLSNLKFKPQISSDQSKTQFFTKTCEEFSNKENESFPENKSKPYITEPQKPLQLYSKLAISSSETPHVPDDQLSNDIEDIIEQYIGAKNECSSCSLISKMDPDSHILPQVSTPEVWLDTNNEAILRQNSTLRCCSRCESAIKRSLQKRNEIAAKKKIQEERLQFEKEMKDLIENAQQFSSLIYDTDSSNCKSESSSQMACNPEIELNNDTRNTELSDISEGLLEKGFELNNQELATYQTEPFISHPDNFQSKDYMDDQDEEVPNDKIDSLDSIQNPNNVSTNEECFKAQYEEPTLNPIDRYLPTVSNTQPVNRAMRFAARIIVEGGSGRLPHHHYNYEPKIVPRYVPASVAFYNTIKYSSNDSNIYPIRSGSTSNKIINNTLQFGLSKKGIQRRRSGYLRMKKTTSINSRHHNSKAIRRKIYTKYRPAIKLVVTNPDINSDGQDTNSSNEVLIEKDDDEKFSWEPADDSNGLNVQKIKRDPSRSPDTTVDLNRAQIYPSFSGQSSTSSDNPSLHNFELSQRSELIKGNFALFRTPSATLNGKNFRKFFKKIIPFGKKKKFERKHNEAFISALLQQELSETSKNEDDYWVYSTDEDEESTLTRKAVIEHQRLQKAYYRGFVIEFHDKFPKKFSAIVQQQEQYEPMRMILKQKQNNKMRLKEQNKLVNNREIQKATSEPFFQNQTVYVPPASLSAPNLPLNELKSKKYFFSESDIGATELKKDQHSHKNLLATQVTALDTNNESTTVETGRFAALLENSNANKSHNSSDNTLILERDEANTYIFHKNFKNKGPISKTNSNKTPNFSLPSDARQNSKLLSRKISVKPKNMTPFKNRILDLDFDFDNKNQDSLLKMVQDELKKDGSNEEMQNMVFFEDKPGSHEEFIASGSLVSSYKPIIGDTNNDLRCTEASQHNERFNDNSVNCNITEGNNDGIRSKTLGFSSRHNSSLNQMESFEYGSNDVHTSNGNASYVTTAYYSNSQIASNQTQTIHNNGLDSIPEAYRQSQSLNFNYEESVANSPFQTNENYCQPSFQILSDYHRELKKYQQYLRDIKKEPVLNNLFTPCYFRDQNTKSKNFSDSSSHFQKQSCSTSFQKFSKKMRSKTPASICPAYKEDTENWFHKEGKFLGTFGAISQNWVSRQTMNHTL